MSALVHVATISLIPRLPSSFVVTFKKQESLGDGVMCNFLHLHMYVNLLSSTCSVYAMYMYMGWRHFMTKKLGSLGMRLGCYHWCSGAGGCYHQCYSIVCYHW